MTVWVRRNDLRRYMPTPDDVIRDRLRLLGAASNHRVTGNNTSLIGEQSCAAFCHDRPHITDRGLTKEFREALPAVSYVECLFHDHIVSMVALISQDLLDMYLCIINALR